MRQPANKPTFIVFPFDNPFSPCPPSTSSGQASPPPVKGGGNNSMPLKFPSPSGRGLRGGGLSFLTISIKNLFARGGTSLSSVIYGSGNLLCKPPVFDASLKITR